MLRHEWAGSASAGHTPPPSVATLTDPVRLASSGSPQPYTWSSVHLVGDLPMQRHPIRCSLYLNEHKFVKQVTGL